MQTADLFLIACSVPLIFCANLYILRSKKSIDNHQIIFVQAMKQWASPLCHSLVQHTNGEL